MTKQWAILITLGSILCGCAKEQTPQDKAKLEVLDWQRIKYIEYYWKESRTRYIARFSNDLVRMSEPTFWGKQSSAQSTNHFYRFIWLRTFNAPIVITLSETDGKFQLTRKIFCGEAGFGGGPLSNQVTFTESQVELHNIMSALDGWLRYIPECDGPCAPDGATWMIDGVMKNGQYFFVHRWSPQSGWVRDMGLRMLSAAQIKNEPIY